MATFRLGRGSRSAPLGAALTLLGCTLASGCGETLPTPAGDDAPIPPVDYSRPDVWLARPGKASAAGLTPKDGGFSNLQDQARADVFYVHPTTSMRGDVQNAPIDDPDAAALSRLMLMGQATSFNAVGRVFAPYYRQITLPTYDLGEDEQQTPNNRAYADVRRAFEYYVEHDNGGRPFFLVGHSQGANHAQRLLSEVIQGRPIEQRLVAAYLPGQPLPRSVFEHDLTRIPPCTEPAQTGCVAVWGVFGDGADVDFDAWEQFDHWVASRGRWMATPGQPLVNINPVSWSVSEPETPASRHRGAVPFGVAGTNFTAPRPGLVRVRDDGRFAFVSPTPLPADLFDDGGVFGGANYHVFDINLFWLDLRENARLRLSALLKRQDGATYPLLGSTAAVTAHVGQAFEFRIEADNAPTEFHAEGLPPELTLDAASGVLTGVPARAGVYALVLSAKNANGEDRADLALTVED